VPDLVRLGLNKSAEDYHGKDMIDLHCHILPAVDDGAADIEESLAIARQLASEGVTRVAATPHLDPENHRGVSAERVRELVSQLREKVRDAGIAIDIVPGHEIFLTPEVPDLLSQGAAQSLAGGRAVLVELSFFAEERPLFLDDTLFRLQLEGFRPILAHPERYPFVRRDPSVLEPLVSRGVVMQLTAQSLSGLQGPQVRKTAEVLLRKGLYQVASSDRHHPGPDRSLAEMHSRIEEIADTATAEMLLSINPQRLLDDLEPEAPLPVEAEQLSFLGRIFGGNDG
jgi:protein-tyrosine phosphatase